MITIVAVFQTSLIVAMRRNLRKIFHNLRKKILREALT